jgi:predicted amidohydrolase YtcJ
VARHRAPGRRSARLASRAALPAALLVAASLAPGLAAAAEAATRGSAATAAERIWVGGPIVTVDDAKPSAEAVAVRGGRIVGVGSRDEVMKRFRGPSTQVSDLGGRTLVPGFIDGHGHMSQAGLQALAANLLPPPDGRGDSIAGLQTIVREWMSASPIAKRFGIVIGFGWDDSQLSDARAPTAADLDAISTTLPVALIHQSGHLGAYNTKALEMAGISAATPDPQGGVIRRRAGTKDPDGVLEETAHMGALLKLLPKLGAAEGTALIEAGQAAYLRFGHTTAQDGRLDPGTAMLYPAVAKAGKLKLDVVGYIDLFLAGDGPATKTISRQYANGWRLGGVKLNFDGSPQGKTAWLTAPYFKVPTGQKDDYIGYPTFKEAEAAAFVAKAYARNWQLLVHTSGDAAIDQLIRTVDAASKAFPAKDRRTVMIHGHAMRADQVESVERLGIFPSLFPMHTFYWGDWHRDSVFGPQRGPNISPAGWVLARGMRFSSHHDAPVALPDTIRVLAATVNRTTRSGQVLGPEHRVEPIVALKAMTLWAAYQHFEEATKGSITVGKLADFAVLSDNPLAVDRARLSDLKVTETIKRGRTVWSADAKTAAGPACADDPRCADRWVRAAPNFLPVTWMSHRHRH